MSPTGGIYTDKPKDTMESTEQCCPEAALVLRQFLRWVMARARGEKCLQNANYTMDLIYDGKVVFATTMELYKTYPCTLSVIFQYSKPYFPVL